MLCYSSNIAIKYTTQDYNFFLFSLARTNTPLQQCLQELASASEMGRMLEGTEYEGYEESAVLRYLHDFVRMVHKTIVPEEEKVEYDQRS